ncbi:hypothetical protein RvY_17467 [Ramazzottius varieornatus]|uniref:Ral GTPase-activating protein subunit alpha/beta N-terminal domain-containing protein n=1 Tax=Ramazzottius varieornatus TaxID=947166 RepID=A0A1D1W279_RAMVA|nr:hypothetical protein RvY_17467 [Ramazzottius varieornatus]
MFSEWSSLVPSFQEDRSSRSSLHLLPRPVVIEVCKNVCKCISTRSSGVSLPSAIGPAGIVKGTNEESTRAMLETEEMVQYCMEVLSFALSLDFEHYEVINDASNTYCEWLSALSHVPKPSVPDCIRTSPNLYCQKILKHLYNIFVPRETQTKDSIEKQAMLCHRVLRAVKTVFQSSETADSETWNVLLQTLLSIVDTVLSRPSKPEDFSDIISKGLLSAFFELWLIVCQRSFPSAVFWRTFSQMNRTWWHRLPVVEEWLRTALLLHDNVQHSVAGTEVDFRSFPQDSSIKSVISALPKELLIQTFMRILLLANDPSNIVNKKSNPAAPSRPKLAPGGLPNLPAEPSKNYSALIFLKLMMGITAMVDLALGIRSSLERYLDITWPAMTEQAALTPSHPLDGTHGHAMSSPLPLLLSSADAMSLSSKSRPLRCEERVACHGLLHLFGPWLFQASFIGRPESPLKVLELAEAMENTESISFGLPNELEMLQPGRAEAVGTLCRLFSMVADGDLLPLGVTARMGLALTEAAALHNRSSYALTNAIRNCHDLFRSNLPGFETVIPALLPALELCILHKLPSSNLYPEMNADDLRSSALHLVSSIICMPKYFDLLPIYDIRAVMGRPSKDETTLTFGSMYYRLLDIVLGSIVNEANSANCMLLLGCLYALLVQPCFESDVQEASEVRLANGNKVFVALTHLLTSKVWQQDGNLSYACLDFFHTAAQHSPKLLNQATAKLASLTLCRYIQEQASRPSRAHSKDLHSRIIVAYHGLMAWILAWPSLVQDSEVVNQIAAVVEVGLAGVKQTNVLKTSQQITPLSSRVKDTAELTQLILLEFVGSNKDPGAIHYMDSLLAEEDFLPKNKAVNPLNDGHFLFFSVDGTTVLSVLPSAAASSMSIVVERSPSCRRVYRFRFVKRSSSKASEPKPEPEVPKPKVFAPSATPKAIKICDDADWDFVAFRNEIPGFSKIHRCKADGNIPTFASVLAQNETVKKEVDFLLNLVDRLEKNPLVPPSLKTVKPFAPVPIKPGAEDDRSPEVDAVIVTQLLSHLGLKPSSATSNKPSFLSNPLTVQLDHKNPELREALDEMDRISIRPLDWLLAFYVKAEDRTAADILRNGHDLSQCSQAYLRFLLSLGWPLRVSELASSRTVGCATRKPKPVHNDLSRLDGKEWCLMRSRTTEQLGVVVPSAENSWEKGTSPDRSSPPTSGMVFELVLPLFLA